MPRALFFVMLCTTACGGSAEPKAVGGAINALPQKTSTQTQIEKVPTVEATKIQTGDLDKAFDMEESQPTNLNAVFDIEESKPATNLDRAFDIEESKPAEGIDRAFDIEETKPAETTVLSPDITNKPLVKTKTLPSASPGPKPLPPGTKPYSPPPQE